MRIGNGLLYPFWRCELIRDAVIRQSSFWYFIRSTSLVVETTNRLARVLVANGTLERILPSGVGNLGPCYFEHVLPTSSQSLSMIDATLSTPTLPKQKPLMWRANRQQRLKSRYFIDNPYDRILQEAHCAIWIINTHNNNQVERRSNSIHSNHSNISFELDCSAIRWFNVHKTW